MAYELEKELEKENPSTPEMAPLNGRAREEGVTSSEVDQEELAKGIAMEMEHTLDEETARRLALDHLAEIPDYYTRLEAMEAEALGSMEGEEVPAEEAGEVEEELEAPAVVEEDEDEEVGAVDQTSDESLDNFMKNKKRKKGKGNPAPSVMPPQY
jgi:hypothetical protein